MSQRPTQSVSAMLLKKESDFNNQHLFTEGLYFQYFGEMRDLEFLSGFSGVRR